MLSTLRRNGNSIVITVPREEMEKVGAHEGELVDVQIRPVEIRPRLTPRVEAALAIELANGREALRYLADH